MSNRNAKPFANYRVNINNPMPVDVIFAELSNYVDRLQNEAIEAREKGRTNETYLEDAHVYEWAANKIDEYIDGLKYMRGFLR